MSSAGSPFSSLACPRDRLAVITALEHSGRVTVRVTGNSMRPLLRPGDHIEAIPARPEGPAPGDIVLLGTSPPVVHRFLTRSPRGLVTRGDAASSYDFPWHESQVLGHVVIRVRGERITRLRYAS